MKDEQDAVATGLERTYTIKEVAAHFNVQEQTVRRWIKRKLITARRAGMRKLFFTKRDIDAAATIVR